MRRGRVYVQWRTKTSHLPRGEGQLSRFFLIFAIFSCFWHISGSFSRVSGVFVWSENATTEQRRGGRSWWRRRRRSG
jgi:hypothetical protein